MTRACRGCESGGECKGVDPTKAACFIQQASVDGGSVADAGRAPDAGDGGGAAATGGVCVECIDGSTCNSAGKPACDTSTHTCVQCVADADCPYTAPVCDLATKKCGPCTGDDDCTRFAPAVCKTSLAATDAAPAPARCATASEVVIVDESNGCSDAGTSATFCTLPSAVAALMPGRNIMIIAGGTSDRLTLATTNVAPVVIGRKNAAGDPGSIPATTGTAVTVSSDTVTIRDLTVNLGSSATSRGIGISGAGTSATLLRVTANLTTGLGIDVENSATATIDQSYVQNNSVGGILVNGAAATIQNTIITDNAGYGV
ncbi:MAG TPA: right-handed parallel beta-helix repeat-containing protein, partial [Polyangia bacterium]|nr:right-handed parallel beta-helix repeat-containing protein [Polyangia bacterium]